MSMMFAAIEGLADGGVKMGLPRDLSIKLAAHTLLGAAKMVLETGEHPAVLKEEVQSPAGSTIYGIHELERGGMRGLLINAVEAASNRSKNVGDQNLPRQSIHRTLISTFACPEGMVVPSKFDNCEHSPPLTPGTCQF
uniref:pyrroline-5-carboxylate reductase n=1 Tax=Panagrellus redivivus TaxID=6233 RepID=A0A7E4VNA2_PANRE